MKSTTYRRILYAIVVLMIGLVAAFSVIPSKSAAAGKFQYKAVFYGRSTTGDVTVAMQKCLDEYAEQGWELVAVEPMAGNLIFRR